MSNENDKNLDKLIELFGKDPGKESSPTADIFKEVFDELNEAERKNKKEEVRKLLMEIISLRKKQIEIKKRFDKEYNESENTIGKLLKKVSNWNTNSSILNEETVDKETES